MEEKKEVNLHEVGDWEVLSMAAGWGEYRATVYNSSLQCALRVGCAMIELKKPYKEPSLHWFDNETIIYTSDDPWAVKIRKANKGAA